MGLHGLRSGFSSKWIGKWLGKVMVSGAAVPLISYSFSLPSFPNPGLCGCAPGKLLVQFQFSSK